MGFCAGFSAPGYANPGPRFGLGFGWGRGRGYRYWASELAGWGRLGYPGVIPKDELSLLRDQAKFLEEQLKIISQRMAEIEGSSQK
jgi:hypothetical protein